MRSNMDRGACSALLFCASEVDQRSDAYWIE